MKPLNSIIIEGNVAMKPTDLRNPDGIEFLLSVQQNIKIDGENKISDYGYRTVVYGKQSDNLKKIIEVGSRIRLVGRLETHNLIPTLVGEHLEHLDKKLFTLTS